MILVEAHALTVATRGFDDSNVQIVITIIAELLNQSHHSTAPQYLICAILWSLSSRYSISKHQGSIMDCFAIDLIQAIATCSSTNTQ